MGQSEGNVELLRCPSRDERQIMDECASTATLLSNVMLKRWQSPYESFYGKEAGYSRSLRIFGEVRIKLSQLYEFA
jgi:hypothetical protein